MIPLPEGTLFAQRYRVVQLIGQGGMGAVYEVVHLETERRRALKVMHPNIIENEDMRARFRLEAKVAAQVESEYIVDVFDAGIDQATQMPFLVMELLRGEELKKTLKRLGRLPPSDAVLYLHQTSLALDKTHRANIVHRDLKPDNLFLTHREDGRPHVKVLDFGVAKFITDGGTQANATRSVGTPLYMAPEQFLMTNNVCAQSDIYALGMIAYTMLVGYSYWVEEARSGANIYALSARMGAGPPEPASERAKRRGVVLPPRFDEWFARATAQAPGDRFESASLAVAALADAIGVPRPGYDSQTPTMIGAPGPTSAPASALGPSSVDRPSFGPAAPSGVGSSGSGAPMSSGSGAPMSSGPGAPMSSVSIPPELVVLTGGPLVSTNGASKGSKGRATAAIAAISASVLVLGAVLAALLLRGGGSTTSGSTGASAASASAPVAPADISAAVPSVIAAPAPLAISASPAEEAPPAPEPVASAKSPKKAVSKGSTAANRPPPVTAAPPPKKDLFTRD